MKSIELLSASAGSGKTYRLTEELYSALEKGLAPSEVMATTFTVKAARELQERVRQKLLEKGLLDKAQLLEGACMGTVHSVCSQLLSLFCFEAGISPLREIVPEKLAASILRKALAKVVEEYQPLMRPLAERLQIDDWLQTVRQIIDLARSNAIPPQELSQHGERSWHGFSALLPEPLDEEEGHALKRELAEEMESTIAAIVGNGDTTKTTKEVVEYLERLKRMLKSSRPLAWGEWVKLSKCKPGKKSQPACAALIEIASQHATLPHFQKDVREFITLVFSCAGKAMQAFADYKTEHGLQDYNDLEALALQVLEESTNLKQVSQRFRLLLVDEFQDTSPLQLAIFLRLVQAIERSIWVGDQKQAIFGFRGTDPLLMDAVVEAVGDPGQLDRSWRSRPELVTFTNALFTPVFEKQGIPPERVRLKPERKDILEGPSLMFWKLEAKNTAQDAAAIAAAIAGLLQGDPPLQVFDKVRKTARNVLPGDILVMCRKNDNARAVATALEACGITATVASIGLLHEPEVIAVLAGYRWLLDPGDSLAAAELVHLLLLDEEPHGWLQKAIQTPGYMFWNQYPLLHSFEEHREHVTHLSPSECLEYAIKLLDLEHVVLGWGACVRRQANLEALRSLAVQYEEQCQVERHTATHAGLLIFLHALVKDKADEQAVFQDEDSVRVMTYHKAKGLEAPVAVLTDIDAGQKATPFGLAMESSETFRMDAPLEGRKIRFWPWPYGRQQKGYGYEEAVSASPEQAKASEREAKEAARLLYVGMTRARDCLILAARDQGKGNKTSWLDEVLSEVDSVSIGEAPDGSFRIHSNDGEFTFATQWFSPDLEETTAESKVYYEPLPGPRIQHPRATFAPSSVMVQDVPEPHVMTLGSRPELRGYVDMAALGSALHAFFAADHRGGEEAARQRMAETILSRWGINGLNPETLVTTADRLYQCIHEHFSPEFEFMHECPMALRKGLQTAQGRIDMLVRGPQGLLLVDHKSFPGSMKQISKRAKAAYGQLLTYREAVERSTNEKVIALWMHLPLACKVFSW